MDDGVTGGGGDNAACSTGNFDMSMDSDSETGCRLAVDAFPEFSDSSFGPNNTACSSTEQSDVVDSEAGVRLAEAFPDLSGSCLGPDNSACSSTEQDDGESLPRATIECIPEEILEMILDHLSCEDHKAASLVNRRWSRVAFSPRCLSRVIRLFPWGSDWWNEYHMKQLYRSQRRYQNVLIINYHKRQHEWLSLVHLLSWLPGVITGLQSLARFTCAQMTTLYALFPRLQHVCVGIANARDDVIDMLKLEDSTVSELSNVLVLSVGMMAHEAYGFSVLGRSGIGRSEAYIFKDRYSLLTDFNQIRLMVRLCWNPVELANPKPVAATMDSMMPVLHVLETMRIPLTTLISSVNWLTSRAVRALDCLQDVYLFGSFSKNILSDFEPMLMVIVLTLRIEQIEDVASFVDTVVTKVMPNVDIVNVVASPISIQNDIITQLTRHKFRLLSLTIEHVSLQRWFTEEDVL